MVSVIREHRGESSDSKGGGALKEEGNLLGGGRDAAGTRKCPAFNRAGATQMGAGLGLRRCFVSYTFSPGFSFLGTFSKGLKDPHS